MKKKEIIEVDVHIPSLDGTSVESIVKAKVSAVFDEDYKDYLLDGDALAEIERVKARHMGLLTPDEIKNLRARLDVTQKELAELLQIGEKSWSRWETGRERPSFH
jgi:DNA-binding transcriptional regulator YiaG